VELPHACSEVDRLTDRLTCSRPSSLRRTSPKPDPLTRIEAAARKRAPESRAGSGIAGQLLWRNPIESRRSFCVPDVIFEHRPKIFVRWGPQLPNALQIKAFLS
jgi:hypothetical protein